MDGWMEEHQISHPILSFTQIPLVDLLFLVQYEAMGSVHITWHWKYLYLSKHYGGSDSKLLHIKIMLHKMSVSQTIMEIICHVLQCQVLQLVFVHVTLCSLEDKDQ